MSIKHDRLRVLRPDEVPPPASEAAEAWATEHLGWDRRTFLAHLGASLSLAGLGGCSPKPAARLVPYVERPVDVTPGVPSAYATSMVLGGHAVGLVVRSNEGRPTKVEGNPEHPASLGAAGVPEQAILLSLYDPHRARALTRRHEVRSWREFSRILLGTSRPEDGPPATDRGRGLAFLLEPTSSPTLIDLVERVRARLPEASFHFFDPLATDAERTAAEAAYGRPLETELRLEGAAVVLDLDANVLDEGPFRLRYARQFAEGRRLRGVASPMNRLYVAETRPSPTGILADHRLRVRHRDVLGVAAAVTAQVVARHPALAGLAPALTAFAQRSAFTDAAAADLLANTGASVVVAGPRQPPEVHVLAAIMNSALGSDGRTTTLKAPAVFEAGGPSHDLGRLRARIDAGEVQRLVVLGGNPAYSAPRDLDLAGAFRAVRQSFYLGPYENETAQAVEWLVPEAHLFERWGDARAYDGTLSFIQPLIEPLYGGRTPEEVLGLFVRERRSVRELVASRWTPLAEDGFRSGLERGFIAGSRFAEENAPLDRDRAFRWLEATLAARGTPSSPAPSLAGAPSVRELELSLYPDPRMRCGEFTNNPWLLELPDPATKLTWGNAALVSPATASALAVETGDAITLRAESTHLEVPVFVLPGHAEGSVSLALGFGRRGGELLAAGVGIDATALRTRAHPFTRPVLVAPAPNAELPARPVPTQQHTSLEGRPIILSTTLAQYRAEPHMFAELNTPTPTTRRPQPEAAPQWAMTIDLGVCTGCSACVVACQAENNVPVVGRLNVEKSREMHWLRVDRYFEGDRDDPKIFVQPMACQHCERAPCEYVCPVGATLHSDDGLNDMIYNRCVGTRFCANNCPYKVRRFNWFNFHADEPLVVQMARNPEVTVRERGVMEKCTYCVQRIRNVETTARGEGRPVLDGEIEPACAQACPTRAIVFGDKSDPLSKVATLREDPRAYAVLHETGSEPRTRYLARIQNPSASAPAPSEPKP